MLGTSKTRRLAVLLALAAATSSAGYLAAQGAIVRGSAAGARPVKITDCDNAGASCGYDGGILNGGAPSGPGAGSGGGAWDPPVCGNGTRIFCQRDSSWTCLQWVPQQSAGGGGVTGINGSTTMTCGKSSTIVRTLYYP